MSVRTFVQPQNNRSCCCLLKAYYSALYTSCKLNLAACRSQTEEAPMGLYIYTVSFLVRGFPVSENPRFRLLCMVRRSTSPFWTSIRAQLAKSCGSSKLRTVVSQCFAEIYEPYQSPSCPQDCRFCSSGCWFYTTLAQWVDGFIHGSYPVVCFLIVSLSCDIPFGLGMSLLCWLNACWFVGSFPAAFWPSGTSGGQMVMFSFRTIMSTTSSCQPHHIMN